MVCRKEARLAEFTLLCRMFSEQAVLPFPGVHHTCPVTSGEICCSHTTGLEAKKQSPGQCHHCSTYFPEQPAMYSVQKIISLHTQNPQPTTPLPSARLRCSIEDIAGSFHVPQPQLFYSRHALKAK